MNICAADQPDDLRSLQTTFIMNRAREGDRLALEELVRRLQPLITDLVRAERRSKVLKQYFETQDFTNDVAAELIRYLPQLQARDSNTLEAYLRRVVRTTLYDAYDRLRAKRRDVARNRPIPTDTSVHLDPPVGGNTSISGAASRAEEAAQVRALLLLLGPMDEEIFLRAKLLNETTQSIADDFGKTDAWVRMRVVRANVRLVKLMNLTREGRLKEDLARPPEDEDENEEERVAER